MGSTSSACGRRIDDAEHRPLTGLPGRLHPQIRTSLGPGAGEIGMGQSLGLVLEQEDDVPGCGLLLQQAKAPAGPVNRVGVLSPLQRAAGPWAFSPRACPVGPAEAPFLRITRNSPN